MGLQLGVVGRWARFTLYLGRGSEDGLAVEVRSERGEHGFCHITGRGASSGASSGEAAAEQEYKVRLHLICGLRGASRLCSAFPVLSLIMYYA